MDARGRNLCGLALGRCCHAQSARAAARQWETTGGRPTAVTMHSEHRPCSCAASCSSMAQAASPLAGRHAPPVGDPPARSHAGHAAPQAGLPCWHTSGQTPAAHTTFPPPPPTASLTARIARKARIQPAGLHAAAGHQVGQASLDGPGAHILEVHQGVAGVHLCSGIECR